MQRANVKSIERAGARGHASRYEAARAAWEKIGVPPRDPYLYHVLVMIREAPKKIGSIHLPDLTRDEVRYQAVAAQVLGMGPLVYNRPDYPADMPRFQIGDWVLVPPYEGFPLTYGGVPCRIYPDDRILMKIDDPADVGSINVADKI